MSSPAEELRTAQAWGWAKRAASKQLKGQAQSETERRRGSNPHGYSDCYEQCLLLVMRSERPHQRSTSARASGRAQFASARPGLSPDSASPGDSALAVSSAEATKSAVGRVPESRRSSWPCSSR